MRFGSQKVGAINMPSLEETRRQVKESLDRQARDEVDHDNILAGLQDEIDRHNAVKDGLRRDMRKSKRSRQNSEERSERSAKFRFKDGVSDPRKRKRKHRSQQRDRDGHEKSKSYDYPTPSDDEAEAAHPFPRDPETDASPSLAPGDDAFRDSLFDALADDEGAHYWESVYSQPIHVYSRPTVRTSDGKLEQMNDEQYAAYVKTKMWERKHPEIVLERERSERKRKEEEEERTRRREEFVRRKERQAWERAERKGAKRHMRGSEEEEGEDQHEYTFAGEGNQVRDKPAKSATAGEDYAAAWSRYLADWDKLQHELLAERAESTADTTIPSKRIPWPILSPSKGVTRDRLEDFLRNAPADDVRSRLQILKAERVRWHPDKIQQRFGGAVDESTMKLVTSVFQVVDMVFEEERMAAR